MKTVVIHQPDFLPYLGFFHRLLHVDCYVVLDTVQFLRGSRSWHHRDRIKTPKGIAWLTIPVVKAPQKTAIREMRISYDQPWQEQHLNMLKRGYRTAPFFEEIIYMLEDLYLLKPKFLQEFTIASIRMLMDCFAINLPLVMASDLDCEGSGNELLVNILKHEGASRYLSGTGARAYFSPEQYIEADIKVLWQYFEHPVYPQLHGPFEPFLSSLDLLFNCGKTESQNILRSI